MPTERSLPDLDAEEVKDVVKRMLQCTDVHGMCMAIIAIFECLVVLASLKQEYTVASTRALSKLDRVATQTLKHARDVIAHNYFDSEDVKSNIGYIVAEQAITRLCIRLFKRSEIGNLCSLFEQRLSLVCKGEYNESSVVLQKIMNKIPPAALLKYSGSDVERVLQFVNDTYMS